MTRSRRWRALLAGFALAFLVASVAEAAGRAARTRPGGGAGGTAPRVASGRATYGYTGSYSGWGYAPYYYPYGSWYYDPWWSFGFSVGWPYYYPYPGCWADACGALPVGTTSVPAAVETAVTPKKANLFLDGEAIGQARDFNGTWDVLPVNPGNRVLRFEAEGYKTLEVRLDARPGRRYRIHEALEPGEGMDPRSDASTAEVEEDESVAAPAFQAPPPTSGGIARGLLHIRVRPDDAVIYLDGKFLGSAEELSRLHGALPVAAGEHRVEVVRPGFTNETVLVDVATGQPATVDMELSREP